MHDPSHGKAAAFDEAANWYILLREAPDDAALHERFTQWFQAEATHAEAWTAMGYTVAAIERTPLDLRAQVRGR